VFVKKKLPEQLGLHCYAASTHPDEFVLQAPPKKILDQPMSIIGSVKVYQDRLEI